MAVNTPPPGMPTHRLHHDASSRELRSLVPETDIIEQADGFHLFLDMPGMDKHSLRIALDGNELTIVAHTRFDLDKAMRGGKTLAHMEFGGGEYRASFTISDDVDRERIKATVFNGVVDVYLPRSQRATTRIEILRG